MSDTAAACQHGTQEEVDTQHARMAGVPMAAPGRSCPCCGGFYYFIDSTQVSFYANGARHANGSRHTQNCEDCGGGYENWTETLGDVPPDEPDLPARDIYGRLRESP
jgi:hypothetical protein